MSSSSFSRPLLPLAQRDGLIRLRYRFGTWLSDQPWLYTWLRSKAMRPGQVMVNPGCQIVIEGFPRSGNSFAYNAFRQVNPDVQIAHHLHVPAQIRMAARLRIPMMILIRDPEAAVSSLLVRQPSLNAGIALDRWMRFYRTAHAFRDRLVLVPFGELTRDFSSAITRVNRRFGTTFGVFAHTPANAGRVFSVIEQLHVAAFGEVRHSHLPRPSEKREALKRNVDLSTARKAVADARALYASLVEGSE